MADSEVGEMKASRRQLRIARNSLLNMVGVIVPALAALAATPLLLSQLSAQLFGIFSIQLAVLVLLSVNDLGISRAVLLVSISRGGYSDPVERDTTARAGIQLVLLLSAAITTVSIVAFAAQHVLSAAPSGDLALSWLLVGLAAAIAVPALPIRAKLEVEERFAALNILRSIGSSLLFLAPLAAIWIEPSLSSAAAGHLASRTVVLLSYMAVAGAGSFQGILQSLPRLVRSLPSLQPFPVHRALVQRGAWLGVGALTSTFIGYVDRFALGLLGTAAAVAHYTVAAELVTKMWLVVGALTAAATPQIAAGWERRDGGWRAPFRFLAISVCCLAIGGHAIFSFFGEDLLRLWLGTSFDPQMVPLLAILSIGIAVNCVTQMNYVLLLVAGGERKAANLLFVTLLFTAIASVAAASTWGATGVAWVFTGRLLLDTLVVRYLARTQTGRRDAGIPSGVLLLIMVIALAISAAAGTFD